MVCDGRRRGPGCLDESSARRALPAPAILRKSAAQSLAKGAVAGTAAESEADAD